MPRGKRKYHAAISNERRKTGRNRGRLSGRRHPYCGFNGRTIPPSSSRYLLDGYENGQTSRIFKGASSTVDFKTGSAYSGDDMDPASVDVGSGKRTGGVEEYQTDFVCKGFCAPSADRGLSHRYNRSTGKHVI